MEIHVNELNIYYLLKITLIIDSKGICCAKTNTITDNITGDRPSKRFVFAMWAEFLTYGFKEEKRMRAKTCFN
jgi:hypothetical protein